MITYEQEKIKNKGSKKMVNIKTAENLGVVHTHTHIFIREWNKKQIRYKKNIDLVWYARFMFF